jgi:putative chitinase
MLVTLEQLQQLFPATPAATLKPYVGPINDLLPQFHIDQPLRLRAFLAQCGHESGNFKYKAEGLNYSVEGLTKTFGKYFTPALARKYARKPEAIASRVYANRMGNGDEASGEGFKFRGRGLIQITGKNNYSAFARFIGKDLDTVLKYMDTEAGAVHSACWFWASMTLNGLADIQAMKTITKKINGGFNGLEDRMELYRRSKFIFG